MQTPPRNPASPRAGIPSFDERLENEEAVVDAMAGALAKGELEPGLWDALHAAAGRDERVSELAFAYESVAQGRKLKTLPPAVQAELLYRAATFFGDVLGDAFGATTYLEKALALQPGHVAAFERLDDQLTQTGDDKKLADACVTAAPYRARDEQLALLRRAAALYDRAGAEDKATEVVQQLVKLEPTDESLRDVLVARYARGSRFRDVARLLEQALAHEPSPEADEAARIRATLVDVFANHLKEPERAMPHVEALLAHDPAHAEARRVAMRLLESKGLAARAAAALAPGAETTEERGRYLAIELENTRGPKRRDVLLRVGILRQDELGDEAGALEAFEQALGIDPSDDLLRRRYLDLGVRLKGALDVARVFARVSTVAKDPGVRARLTAEMGELFVAGGDERRGRTTLAGVLATANQDPHAVLVAGRALARIHEAEGDKKHLVEVLARVAETSPDEEEQRNANERIAAICAETGDEERAIAAYRRLVSSPARARALEALLPLYERREAWIDLSFVLEELAKDEADAQTARALAFRAAEILAIKAKDETSAIEAIRTLIERHGPARDVLALYVPLLESSKQWPELASALAAEAELAPVEERAALLARLGTVELTRTRNVTAAVGAFERALQVDKDEKTSRAALERMLAAGEGRVEAARVLEPVYRSEDKATGLLRTLEIRAQAAEEPAARLEALEEAVDVAIGVSRDRAVDVAARGLGTAVAAGAALAPWLERWERAAEGVDPKKRAELATAALGDRPVDSEELLALARQVGEECAACGDVGGALAAYRRCLAFDPSSAELVARVDELLMEQGNPEERIALYRGALAQDPPPARRRLLLHSIGSIARHELEDAPAAIEAYRTALADDPSDPIAHAALAELYAATGDEANLAALLEAYLDHAPNADERRRARGQLAEVAARRGAADDARTHATALLDDADLPVEALDVVERVAEALSDATLTRRVLALRAERATDPRIKIESYERLARLAKHEGDAPGAARLLHHAADLAQEIADDALAATYLAEVRELAPQDIDAVTKLEAIHARTGAWAELAAMIEVRAALAGDDAAKLAALKELAHVRAERLEYPEGGFEAASRAFQVGPADAEALTLFADLAVRTGSVRAFADATAAADTAALPPSARTSIAIARARVLATTDDTRVEAAKSLRAILASNTDDDVVATGTASLEAIAEAMPPGDARREELRWLASFRVERASAETKPGLLRAWAAREEGDLGDPDAALDLYKRVLTLAPDDVEALAAVARLSLARGDVQGAVQALESRRPHLEGEAQRALDLEVARILAPVPGRGGEALDRVARVLEAAPHETSGLEIAAGLLADDQHGARAAEVIERSIDAITDVEARVALLEQLVGRIVPPRLDLYDRLYDLLVELGRHDRAGEVALAAARAVPAEPAAWDRVEHLAREHEDPEPLAAVYEAVLEDDLPKEVALEVGQRAVAFYEEWFEDAGRVANVLSRLLAIDPQDTWTFDRLKLIYDSAERWDDLFALYDRTAASADATRRVELLEEAAQIAKDFANHSARAIGYLEQLLAHKPNNARIEASLERLYERHGCHRELVQLLTARIPRLDVGEAQKERARVAGLWLEELGDASNALYIVEDMLAVWTPDETVVNPELTTRMLERVLELAPRTAEMRPSIIPPSDSAGRRDSFAPGSLANRMLVRQRAAALLKERYSAPGREADLARILEVELEAVKSVKERIRRYRQIASIYASLGDDLKALEHVVQLVLLEPEVAAHRKELAELADRTGRYERLVDVLVTAADDANDGVLRVELLMHAGVVTAERIGDDARAIDLFSRVLATTPIADDALLTACRLIEPLLARSGRSAERLDVLERLAILEADEGVRARVLAEAARLATEVGSEDRAVWAWEARLAIVPGDDEALDGLVALFERAGKHAQLVEVLGARARGDRPADARRRDRVRIAEIQADALGTPEAAIETWRAIETELGESEEGTRAQAALFRKTAKHEDLAELFAKAAERAAPGAPKAALLRELGDVRRTLLGDEDGAVTSYEAALREDPRDDGARLGLRALIGRPALRAAVTAVLLVAYEASDDWELVLDLTEHRLASAAGVPAQIAILEEAARIVEQRAEDPAAAFALVRRALLLDPSKGDLVDTAFRLAGATRNERSLADALLIATDGHDDAPYAGPLRLRLGALLEERLDDHVAALAAYVAVAEREPEDLDVAVSVVRTAGKTGRPDAAARALVASSAATDAIPAAVLASYERAADDNGWDAWIAALATAVRTADLAGTHDAVSRDLEARIAAWHRDRRGDPDAAEAAFVRALAHDAGNATLLGELAQLQRRAKGRPLVESLLKLSESTGGDLAMLQEAAETALVSVGDRALAKTIYERLLTLAAERWKAAPPAPTSIEDDEDAFGPATSRDLGRSPESIAAHAIEELVRIHGEDGDHAEVVALLLRAAALPWTTEVQRGHRHEAARVADERLDAADEAVGILAALFQEDPHDARAVARLVALYERTGRSQDLLALKRRQVEVTTDESARLAFRLEIAKLEDALGAPAGAIGTLEQNLAESPRHAASRVLLASLLEREGRSRELEAFLAKQGELAAEAGETTAAADLFARAAEVAEHSPDGARAAVGHLTRVVALEPREVAYDALARLEAAAGHDEAAARHLASLRAMRPAGARADVTLRLADALLRAGQKDAALAHLEEELRESPEAHDVRERLATTYRSTGAHAELATLLEGGAAHAPDKVTRLARLREAAELHRTRTGEPARAIPLLEQAADLAPEENAIRLALADALGAAGRFEDARTLLRGLVDAFGGRRPKERAPVHYHLALLDLAMGDRARALVELDAATRIDPANASILRALAELAREDGQLDRAERSYRALLTVLRRQEDPTEDAPITRSEVLFELSRIALRQGEPERATEILESAFEVTTHSHVEALRLEAALRSAGDHAALARALETRLARGNVTGEVDVLTDLARLYEDHLDRAEEALPLRLRAVGLAPESDAVHEAAARLAGVRDAAGQYEDAVREAAEKASASAPQLAGSLFARLGRLAEIARGDDPGAAALYEKALAVRPRDRELLATLDRVYERLADDAGQARLLSMRVALDAEEGGAPADALYRLAQLRFRSGDLKAAADAFEQAFEAEPDVERAEELLAAAADAHPNDARIVDLYERVTRTGGRERSLVDALVRRFSLPGSTAAPMREAVELAQKLEDRDLEESLLRRYLERAEGEDGTSRVWALTSLAALCEAKGDMREAVMLTREAAEIAPPDVARKLLLAVARLAAGPLGDLTLAQAVYEQLHENDEADREAWEPLLDVYRRLGENEKLSGLLERVAALESEPRERGRLRLERVKVRVERLGATDEDAARELREIVDDDPSNVDAAIHLASILERTGQDDALAELLERQLEAAKDREDGAAVSSLSYRLGQLLEPRDEARARDVYAVALDWDPKAKDVLLALERLHEKAGETEPRADLMEKRLAVETGETAEALAMTLAELRKELGDAEAEQRALEIGFRSCPESTRLRDRLEATYRDGLEYRKLAELYETDARGRTAPKAKALRLRDAARVYRTDLEAPADAARVLLEARGDDPFDHELLVELVDVLVAAGDLAQAEAQLTGAIDAATDFDPERIGLVGRRAVIRSKLGDEAGALADFDEAVSGGVEGLRLELAEHLGKMAMAAAGRGDAATWRELRLRIANLRLEMGDIEEARNVLNELLKTDSKDKGTLRALAAIDEREERWDAASATYRRLVGLEEGQELVVAALKLAETCEKAGRLADARGGLERARLAEPTEPRLRERLAWLYEQLGARRELAELVLEEARSVGEVGPRFEGLVRAGMLLLEHGRSADATAQVLTTDAIPPLEEAHALRPADLDCTALLSDAYVGAGRLEEATSLLEATIATFKGRRARELSALYHRLARAAEIGGDKAAALAHLSTGLDMDAQNGAVASELAYLAMEIGNLDVATRALRQITMLKAPAPLPKALAFQYLGEIARHQGDNKRAVMMLKRAIDDDPTLDSARALLEELQQT